MQVLARGTSPFGGQTVVVTEDAVAMTCQRTGLRTVTKVEASLRDYVLASMAPYAENDPDRVFAAMNAMTDALA